MIMSCLSKVEMSGLPFLLTYVAKEVIAMTQEIINMSKKELDRLALIHRLMDKKIKQKDAAGILSLSVRQLRRLIKKVNKEGDKAIIHGNRGRPSNRKYSNNFKNEVIKTIKGKYLDFGPTLAAEKLEEINNIKISKETARKWMIEAGIWIPRKLRNEDNNHTWRKRKECFGEMVQTDGSVGDWFEGRGPRAVMMGYIDDATGIPFARFYASEDTRAAMDSFRKYIEVFGIPQSLYFDRNSIYKTTRKANLDEELRGKGPQTQFDKVLEILNVGPIFAYSPQAKGRIERLFETFKDRLVKEMRLAGVSNIKEGNEFLKDYLPEYSKRFSVNPVNSKNLHREVPQDMDLNWVFAFREKRTVTQDFTIRWRNRFFLLEKQSVAIKNKKVTILENLHDELRIWFKDGFLEFKEITKHSLKKLREESKRSKTSVKDTPKQPWKPESNHPWRWKNKALFQELRS